MAKQLQYENYILYFPRVPHWLPEFSMPKEILGFGQIVTGPPGSGKSTYCIGMTEILTNELLNRNLITINLDPGNPTSSCHVDVTKLVTITDAMSRLRLGPNGSLLYCLEFLEKNFEWLLENIKSKMTTSNKKPYLLIDTPGQVELYTHHTSLKKILERLIDTLSLSLTVVHLVDILNVISPETLISVVTLCLSAMLQLSLPQINVLSKSDLLQQFGSELVRNYGAYDTFPMLDILPPIFKEVYFAQSPKIDDSDELPKIHRIRRSDILGRIYEVVKTYELVGFHVMAIEDSSSVTQVLNRIDEANGYFE